MFTLIKRVFNAVFSRKDAVLRLASKVIKPDVPELAAPTDGTGRSHDPFRHLPVQLATQEGTATPIQLVASGMLKSCADCQVLTRIVWNTMRRQQRRRRDWRIEPEGEGKWKYVLVYSVPELWQLVARATYARHLPVPAQHAPMKLANWLAKWLSQSLRRLVTLVTPARPVFTHYLPAKARPVHVATQHDTPLKLAHLLARYAIQKLQRIATSATTQMPPPVNSTRYVEDTVEAEYRELPDTGAEMFAPEEIIIVEVPRALVVRKHVPETAARNGSDPSQRLFALVLLAIVTGVLIGLARQRKALGS